MDFFKQTVFLSLLVVAMEVTEDFRCYAGALMNYKSRLVSVSEIGHNQPSTQIMLVVPCSLETNRKASTHIG